MHRKKVRRMVTMLLTVLLAVSLSSCNGTSDTKKTTDDTTGKAEASDSGAASVKDEAAGAKDGAAGAKDGAAGAKDEAADVERSDDEVFDSGDGWKVHFDPTVIKAEDNREVADEVSFDYTGQSEGTNFVTISYVANRLPKKAIKDILKAEGNGAKPEISGGFFPGAPDKWGYWITPEPETEEDNLQTEYIVGEYKGGTLMFCFVTHNTGDDEKEIPVSDALAAVIDSIEYDEFPPQTMYDGIPGIYTRMDTDEIEGEEVTAEYAVELNDNHTGMLKLQDDVSITWDDKKIYQDDDWEHPYSYKLKDNKLILDLDGQKLEFTRSEGEGTKYTRERI